MAGFLTRSKNSAFPSFDSGILLFPFTELTAAGTVQDFHLFPSQDFTIKILHHFAAAKVHFFRLCGTTVCINEIILSLPSKRIHIEFIFSLL